MVRREFVGIGLLLVLSMVFASSAFANNAPTQSFFAYTNDVGDGVSGTEGIFELNYSTIDAIQSRFGETFFDNSTDTTHLVWWDDTTPDDLVFYSSTLDGLTKTTPILIYTGGGGGFPTVARAEVFASGNNVFVTWLVETSAGVFSLFEKTSTDNGVSFSVQWTVFSGSVGVAFDSSMELVGNSLDDVVVIYRNSTSDTLESRVSHNNGVTWSGVITLAGDNHGSGNADGFHNFGDQSIKISGNDIDIAFTAEFTGGGCATCDSNFYQKSTDAGDTWLANPLLINEGTVDHTNDEPFLFTLSGDVIDVYYNDEFSSLKIEHARSINGGTSFTLEISNVDVGCSSIGNSFDDWIAVGTDNFVGVFCGSADNVRYKISNDAGATFPQLDTARSQSFTARPTNFLGYTNGTIGMITFLQASGTMGIMSSGADFNREWYRVPDIYSNAEFLNKEGSVSITDQRVIITTAENSGTAETRSVSFEYPVCLPITNLDFNCPLQIGGNLAQDEPSNLAGVATTTGYHTIFQQNGGNNARAYYGASTDGVTAIQAFDISGTVLDATLGLIENDLHIFEDGAGIIDAFWIEDHATVPEAFHARSINGGISFGTKTAIATVGTFGVRSIINIEPVVVGDDLFVLFNNGTLGSASPFFVGGGVISGNTATWGNVATDIDAGGECNVDTANGNLRLENIGVGRMYAMWHGENATSSATGICFNLSTDGGATWANTVQGLDDTSVTSDQTQVFELFTDGTDVTAVWTNAGDEIHQSRSTNSGTSFGIEQIALNTNGNDFGGNDDSACTDPQVLAESIQDGSSIYIICSGSSLTAIKKSSNMGLSYGSLQTVSTRQSENWVAIADSGNVVIVVEDNGSLPSTGNEVFFSDDDGVTWVPKTTFQNFVNHNFFDVITGNATHVWLGYIHETQWDNLSSHNYVTLGVFPSGVPPNTAPVVTILGDDPLQHLLDTTYTDAGATCSDSEDGDLTSSIVTVSTVNSAVLGDYTVTYTCTDSGSLFDEEIRNITVVAEITTTTTTGGGSAGSPTPTVPETGIEGFTETQQMEFDQAVQDAIESIEVSPTTPLEAIIQTFFEFQVIDQTHEQLQLNSFLPDQRLGIRWSTGDDIVIVSATPAPSPFMFTFEQFPFVASGSGAFVSTNSLLYNLQIPNKECTTVITQNCVQKIRYEVPITVNAIINNTQVSDTGSIIVDLVEEAVDPIILIILATAGIPILAVIVQRARGRSTIAPLRRSVSG